MKSSRRGTSPKYFLGLAVSLVFLFTVSSQSGYKVRVVDAEEKVLGVSSVASAVSKAWGEFKRGSGTPKPPIAPYKTKDTPKKPTKNSCGQKGQNCCTTGGTLGANPGYNYRTYTRCNVGTPSSNIRGSCTCI